MAEFNGKRYITKGVNNKIDFMLQLTIWSMIDKNIAEGLKMDYLQIFELKPIQSKGVLKQKIIHRQEIPAYSHEIIINFCNEPITEKIFVIDSDGYITMLLVNEY